MTKTVTGERIRLRLPNEQDIPAIVEACQDPEIAKYTTIPTPFRKAHAEYWIRSAAQKEDPEVDWVVETLDGEFVGVFSRRCRFRSEQHQRRVLPLRRDVGRIHARSRSTRH